MPFDAEITQRSRDLIALEKARERIARAWCQGDDYEPDGPHCVLSARGIFTDGLIDYYADEVQHFARLLGFHDSDAAYLWNDAPSRTQAEVLTRFDAAIAKLSGPDHA